MNTQNILKYYGSKLDVKLDHSEFYDLELCGVNNDYDANLLDFSTPYLHDSLIIDSRCITGGTINTIKPWILNIGENYTGYTCDFTIRRRTELGWTADFIFNRNNLDWNLGNDFFYWGGDVFHPTLHDYLKLSFSPTGRIVYECNRLSGYCHTVSGFTYSAVTETGQTEILPSGKTSEDFQITVTFQRYNEYYGCDIANEGGYNDLITGVTVNNIRDVITGATESVTYNEGLSEKVWNERNKRLGIFKIYLNGGLLFKKENFEEIIVIPEVSGETLNMVVGSGYSGLTDTNFEILSFQYYESPLNFIEVKHNFISYAKENFNISETSIECSDDLIGYTDIGLLTEDQDNLLTEDNNILIY